MSDNGKKLSYDDLLERVKILEQENDVLASRAEEILLLSLLGNSISSINNEAELIDELLEKISILLNVPMCFCFSKEENYYSLISVYDVASSSNIYDSHLILDDEVIKEMEWSEIYISFLQESEPLIHYKFPIDIKANTEILILRFKSLWISEGVFIFLIEHTIQSLTAKVMLIQQAIRLIVDKIDKLTYIKRIEQLNLNLENRVKDRTKALLESNKKLQKEITERKEIQKELERARDKAQESDRLKSVFLANMSHEIRTPMNAVVGFSELLETGICNKEEIQNYSKLIHSNSMMLLNLIDDLLDFSKIEANQLEIHMKSCNINKVLDEVYALGLSLQQQLERKNITLRVIKGEEDINAALITDEHRLKQILLNLVSNALKFSTKGFVTIEYCLKISTIDFVVSDNGIGIDKSMHDAIFNRFTRVGNDKSKSILGNGLGLAITRNLVEMLGGKISVNSEEGKGASFKFFLPR